MKKQMVISITTKDKPGVIARVTEVLYQLEGDVADLNQTVLFGYLTMILGVSFQQTLTRENVFDALSAIKSGDKFEISVKEISPEENPAQTPQPKETYVLTVQGPNKSGIVYFISSICGRFNVNILDLGTSLEKGLYTMALQLDVSAASGTLEELREAFLSYGKEAEQNITMQHNEIFLATNEITLH